MVIASPDRMPADLTLPDQVRLIPLAECQEYVRRFIAAHAPLLASKPSEHIFLVADESGNTSSNIVSEVQDIRLDQRPFEHTRLGNIVNLISAHNLAACIWWEDTTPFIWERSIQTFQAVVLEQLFSDGDVAAGYLPHN